MDLSRDELKRDPHEMYMLAVRTGCRLPDDLHRSMILWGYDGEKGEIAKGYFDWMEKKEELKKSRLESERRLKSIDSGERMLLVGLGMFVSAAVFILLEVVRVG